MPTGTVKLHRVLRAKPNKVYRAFLDADAVSRWLPPNGFTCKIDHFNARVGGTFMMAFRNFGTGKGFFGLKRECGLHEAGEINGSGI